MAHGTVTGKDYNFSFGFGENEEKYNLIYYDDMVDSQVNYFALGHIHQTFNKFIMNRNNHIIASYPGSPVSIAKDEIGKREVIIGKIEDKKLSLNEKEIDTFHWLRKEFTIIPEYEEDFIAELKMVIENFNEKNACLSIAIQGYTVYPEQELNEKIEQIRKISKNKNIEWNSPEFSMVDKKYNQIISEFKKMLNEKLTKEEISQDLAKQCQKIFYRAIAEQKQ